MKRELYDLTDESLLMFTNRVGNVLRAEGVPHNVVGGIAVQSYLLDMLSQKYGKGIQNLLSDHEVRVQDYIRSTDDIDLALQVTGSDDIDKVRKVNSLIEKFPFEEIDPSGQSIIEIKTSRIGASRPTFRIYIDGKGSDEEVLAMNISRGQPNDLKRLDAKWYPVFIDESKKLTVPYNSTYNLTVNVPRIEHLLASKIAGGRAKDLMDNKNLADLVKETGSKIDFSEIERVLLPVYQDEYMSFLRQEYPEKYAKM